MEVVKRPYYIHTPRNIHGEDLVLPYNNVCYEILAFHTGDVKHSTGKDWKELAAVEKKLNDDHETMLAYAMHI